MFLSTPTAFKASVDKKFLIKTFPFSSKEIKTDQKASLTDSLSLINCMTFLVYSYFTGNTITNYKYLSSLILQLFFGLSLGIDQLDNTNLIEVCDRRLLSTNNLF